MLDAVAAWRLEAEGDDLHRYYRISAAHTAFLQAPPPVVVGAAGAGKTALARALVEASTRGTPAVRIALPDALWVALHTVARQTPGEDDGWAGYVVRLAVFQALGDAGVLDGAGIRALAPAFAGAPPQPLKAALSSSFHRALIAEVFDAGTGAGDLSAPSARLADIDAALAPSLAGRTVTVCLDEAPGPGGGDLDVLKVSMARALIRAASEAGAGLQVSVFVRPALFRQAGVASQHLALTWQADALAETIALRLARAASPAFAPGEVRAGSVLRGVFDGGARRALGAAWQRDAVWGGLWRLTRARPRDVIHLLRVAAGHAAARGRSQIDVAALTAARLAHAAYLRDAVIAETVGEVPFIREVFERAPEMRAPMAFGDFVASIEGAIAALEAGEATSDARRVIERLFAASAIGQMRQHKGTGGGQRAVFRHDDPTAELTLGAPIVVHPGIAPAMGAA